MAFVPNSQARIFTRIPDEVTKVWERRVETTRNQVGTSFLDSGHYTTGVLRVKLIVEFDEPTSSADPFISEDHDKDTAIHFWQQTRRQWADLEGALDATLSGFNKAAHDDALKRKDASFIVFRPGMTSFRDRSSQSRIPVTRKTTSVVDSIVPNDSASCVTLTQSEYENLKHKKTSKKKSKSNAPGSLLQYIART